MDATWDDMRPRTLSLASTTYHLRRISPFRALWVFIGLGSRMLLLRRSNQTSPTTSRRTPKIRQCPPSPDADPGATKAGLLEDRPLVVKQARASSGAVPKAGHLPIL